MAHTGYHFRLGDRPQDSALTLLCFPLAEVNAISEHTETLHLSPHITTELVGHGVDQRPEVCEHSCEELANMMRELSGLHVLVRQLDDNLRKVVCVKGTLGGGSSSAGWSSGQLLTH